MAVHTPTVGAVLRRRIVDVLAPLSIVVAVLVCWEFAVAFFGIRAFILPSPSAILAELIASGPTIILPQLRVTLGEILAGYAIAIIVAFVLALLITYSAAFRRGVLPLIVASQTIPIIAIAPILVIWFGYNSVPRILMTAIIAFFPLTVSIATGLQGLDPDYVKLFRSMKASAFDIFRKLRIPVALPNIFAGLKVAATLAVVGATISEWVGASQGLGYLIAQDTAQLNTTRVFASLLVLGLVGMGLFGLVGAIEALCMPWRFADRRGPARRRTWRNGLSRAPQAET